MAVALGDAEMSQRSLEHERSLMWATPDDYLWAEVVPALRARGLVRIVERSLPLRWLGPRVELTQLGLGTRAQLDELLAALAEQFGG